MKNGGTAAGRHVGGEEELLRTSIGTVMAGPVTCRRTGQSKRFYYFDFPSWVNVVALTPEKQILLIRQFRYGTRRVELEIPGGMVDPGEEPLQAGCRELLEETGYAGCKAEIIGRVCPNPAIQKNYCYTVLVHDAVRVGGVQLDEMEDIETLLLPETQVFRSMTDGAIEHGLVLNGLMFYRLWRDKQSLPLSL